MHFVALDQFLTEGLAILAKGPVAIVFAEDAVEVDTTLRHHLAAGFAQVLLLAPPAITLPADLGTKVHRIDLDVHAEGALFTAVNRLIEAAPGIWFYYCYNAEYLFHPFCETRNVRELVAFHAEERREAMLSYVIDLYADDLGRFQNAVSLEQAHLDRSGYYALGRPDPANHNYPKERQLDFFGGRFSGATLRGGDRFQDLQDGGAVITSTQQGQSEFAGHVRLESCGCGWASLRAHPLPSYQSAIRTSPSHSQQVSR